MTTCQMAAPRPRVWRARWWVGRGGRADARRLSAANAQVAAAQAQLNRVLAGATSAEIKGARSRVQPSRLNWKRRKRNTIDRLRPSREQIASADAAVAQAEASLRLFDVQASKLTARAPQDGTIMARNVEVGQVLAPGATVFVIGRLDTLQITVYLPETTYGQVKLGQKAQVTVDSHPNVVFTATVVHVPTRPSSRHATCRPLRDAAPQSMRQA